MPAPFIFAVVVALVALVIVISDVLLVHLLKWCPNAGVALIVIADPALNHPEAGLVVPWPFATKTTWNWW